MKLRHINFQSTQPSSLYTLRNLFLCIGLLCAAHPLHAHKTLGHTPSTSISRSPSRKRAVYILAGLTTVIILGGAFTHKLRVHQSNTFITAAKRGDLDSVTHLLPKVRQHQATLGEGLIKAAKKGHKGIVALLLPQVNTQKFIDQALMAAITSEEYTFNPEERLAVVKTILPKITSEKTLKEAKKVTENNSIDAASFLIPDLIQEQSDSLDRTISK